ncbi:hypothetical protein GGU10DRAFT_380927 [Lentinula aff. detonsa]|uniref:Uncharacterized protein n=1 Tax=Lentinula aff. detonsa TaxID=2804958 RepID=A0AA38KL02_9AGAR|nr:hypothetical protein GGU10DRAFT_380927 [Lentinula aff. detonsa]
MSERSSPDPFANTPEPQLSPMSNLRALMSQRNGVRDRTEFEQDNADPAANGGQLVVIDPALTSTSPLNVMLNRVRAIKRLHVISPDSVRDFEAFENAQSPPEHLAHILLVGLENRDFLRLLTSSMDYKVPETLKTTCKDYAWVYILSPTIMQYKGKLGPDNVLAAMRQLNVNNLPPSSETGCCDVILEIIKKGMTDARHNIKEKRWQFNQYPTYITDRFWNKVDETLVSYRTEFKTAAELQAAFEAIFHSDKVKYGQPDLVLNPLVALRDVDEWLLKVSSAAGPSGISTVAPSAASAAGATSA